MVPVSWAVDGSGSTFIWGFIDAEYKHDMSREEAEAFVTRAISLAMARDGSSGGLIRLVVVRGATRRDRIVLRRNAPPSVRPHTHTDRQTPPSCPVRTNVARTVPGSLIAPASRACCDTG